MYYKTRGLTPKDLVSAMVGENEMSTFSALCRLAHVQYSVCCWCQWCVFVKHNVCTVGYADRWPGHLQVCGWTVPPLSVSQRAWIVVAVRHIVLSVDLTCSEQKTATQKNSHDAASSRIIMPTYKGCAQFTSKHDLLPIFKSPFLRWWWRV